MSHKTFQLKSRGIFKNILRRKFMYVVGCNLSKNYGSEEKPGGGLLKTFSKNSLQDRSIGLILISSGLKKNPVQDNLSF